MGSRLNRVPAQTGEADRYPGNREDIGSNRWTFRGASRGRGRARERRPCVRVAAAWDGKSQPAVSSCVTQTANRRELVERAAKAEQVTELKGVFQTAKTVVVAHYAGLTVAQ